MRPRNQHAVLLVDDSAAQLDALEPAFRDAGFLVGRAADGTEVFRHLAALEPDAMLLDIYMPGLSGADVCRLVKAHPIWRKLFVVLMSARMSERELDAYRRMGADGFLKKPFDPAQAVKAICQGLGQRDGGR